MDTLNNELPPPVVPELDSAPAWVCLLCTVRYAENPPLTFACKDYRVCDYCGQTAACSPASTLGELRWRKKE